MLKRLAALTLAASFTFLGTPAAAAAPTTDPADAAAGWLAGRLVDGDHFVSPFGDAWAYGLTLDSTLSFAAAGVAKTTAGKAITWLSQTDRLEAYAGNGTDRSIAGRYAKLILAADVNGADPANFNGVDLVARLTAREDANGRFADKTSGTDSASPFNQSLAIIALERLPAGASANAVKYLLDAQCPDGSFPFAFGLPTCAGDSDSTTLAMQALAVVGEDTALAKATAWIVAKQKANGAFADDWDGVENANNTAMAVLALKAAGKDTEAGKALAFLKTLQVGCDKPEANRGAVAYDATGYDESTVDYATIQAVWGLAGTPLASLDASSSVADVPALKCETGGTGGGGQLPVTGIQLWTIIVVGGGLVLLGAGVVVLGRRRA